MKTGAIRRVPLPFALTFVLGAFVPAIRADLLGVGPGAELPGSASPTGAPEAAPMEVAAPATVEVAPGSEVQASRLDPALAERILRAAGYFAPGIHAYHRRSGSRSPFESALRALAWGYTYQRPRNTPALDARTWGWLRSEAGLVTAARRRWQGYPNLDAGSQPALWEEMIRRAATHLTAVSDPASRHRLLKALMVVESRKLHWQGYVPIVSFAGAVGACQLLPRTALSAEVARNHHDPAENMQAAARYLNSLIRGAGSLRLALARYNGGVDPPAESFTAYADKILRLYRAGSGRRTA